MYNTYYMNQPLYKPLNPIWHLLRRVVDVLLGLALVMADIAYRRVVSVLICGPTTNSILTRGFLLAVTSEGAHYCVLLSTNAISSPLDVAFGLGGLVLGLALSVLVTT